MDNVRFSFGLKMLIDFLAHSSKSKVLVAASVGLMFGISAVTVPSFSAFMLPLSRAFGWRRGDISVALTIFIICNIFMYPIAGWLVDRIGLRRLLISSTLLFGLAFSGLSLLSGPIWQLYVGYALLGICGIGTSSMIYARLIVAWFVEKRGLALGVAFAGMGVGVSVHPLLVQHIASATSWRDAYLALGLLVMGMTLPLVICWARLPPDESSVGAPRGTAVRVVHLMRAVGSKNAVLMAISFSLLGVLTGSIPGHLIPLLTDRGIDAVSAAVLSSMLGVSFIAGRVAIGYLLDRLFAPLLMAVIVLLAVVGLGILATSLGRAVGFGICLIGFAMGGETDVLTYLVSRYFRLEDFTAVCGVQLAIFTTGMSLGAALMGFSANNTGSYNWALRVLIGTSLVAALPFLFMERYAGGHDRQLTSSRQTASNSKEGCASSPSSSDASARA